MQSRELVKLYYRIGEVSEIVGVQPHVLRYWETEFRSIRPQKSSKGQRVYSRRDVEKLLRVKDLLRNQGFTIAGARKRLSDTPDAGHSAGPNLSGPTAVGPAVVAPRFALSEPALSQPAASAPAVSAPAVGVAVVGVVATSVSAVGVSAVSVPPAVSAAGSACEQGSERGLPEHGLSDHSAKDMRKALLGLRHDLMRMLDQLSARARDTHTQ